MCVCVWGGGGGGGGGKGERWGKEVGRRTEWGNYVKMFLLPSEKRFTLKGKNKLLFYFLIE